MGSTDDIWPPPIAGREYPWDRSLTECLREPRETSVNDIVFPPGLMLRMSSWFLGGPVRIDPTTRFALEAKLRTDWHLSGKDAHDAVMDYCVRRHLLPPWVDRGSVVARLMLWVLVVAIPVFISAHYLLTSEFASTPRARFLAKTTVHNMFPVVLGCAACMLASNAGYVAYNWHRKRKYFRQHEADEQRQPD